MIDVSNSSNVDVRLSSLKCSGVGSTRSNEVCADDGRFRASPGAQLAVMPQCCAAGAQYSLREVAHAE